MKLYLIHRKYYIAFLMAQQKVDAILTEWEQISAKAQPRCTLAEHERDFIATNAIPVKGGAISKAEQYAIEMEQRRIKERLSEAKALLAERFNLLDQKEDEIRKSADLYDRVYTLRWLDGVKAEDIADRLHYSRSQVYKIIGHISAQIERSSNDPSA